LKLKRKFNVGRMRFVYVCSPYRGEVVKNLNYTQECCRKVFSKNDIPIAPHLYFPMFMNDNIEEVRELAFEINKRLIDMCDCLCIFGSVISEGMQIEIDYANSIGKKVYKCGN